MPRFFRDNGLTIVLMLLFAFSLAGQWLTGWAQQNQELARHGQETIGLFAYLSDDEFLATVFENWESEFLQMSAYVVLTAMLFQRGSAESKDPDAPPRDPNLSDKGLRPDAPAMLRAGAAARWIYAHSLGLMLFALFAASFLLHWRYSTAAANQEALEHGEAAQTMLSYLADPQFWFESFQNWQSEFLSTAVLVVLSIYLRQRESPESKPVAAPHGATGAA